VSGETRDELIVEGEIAAVHRGIYAVAVQFGPETRRVLARLSGRLVMHHIRVIAGDRVRVELGAYDPTRGRIVRRL
jgi:translation initiation factor IF-1